MSSPMMPLRVRAHLAGGIAQAAPWGIALDGLLASRIWEQDKAAFRAAGVPYVRAMDRDDPPELDLPLARCETSTGEWHWAATCHQPAPGAVTDVHTWTGSLDHRDLERVATSLPKTVSARQGRYRSRRMPLLVTATPEITWYAVGDADRITELLKPLTSIGKKRVTGEGHVLSWEITPEPELDEFTAGHLHPDGAVGRPIPAECFEHLEQTFGQVTGGGTGRAGLRPPYMHPSVQHELHLPALLDA
jgi:CRISPR type IV-associated protein Csf3